MSQLDQHVNTGADDWTDGDPANNNDPEMIIRYLNDGITIVSSGYCLIDTSSIPDDATITGATFYWYDHDYLEPRGAGVGSSISIFNGSTYDQFYVFTTFTAGAKSHALIAGEWASIDKTGDTQFRFNTVIRSGKNRTWYVRAYDGYSGTNEQPRLVVDYTEAGAGKTKTMILR